MPKIFDNILPFPHKKREQPQDFNPTSNAIKTEDEKIEEATEQTAVNIASHISDLGEPVSPSQILPAREAHPLNKTNGGFRIINIVNIRKPQTPVEKTTSNIVPFKTAAHAIEKVGRVVTNELAPFTQGEGSQLNSYLAEENKAREFPGIYIGRQKKKAHHLEADTKEEAA